LRNGKLAAGDARRDGNNVLSEVAFPIHFAILFAENAR
jgi:hypothetical protein